MPWNVQHSVTLVHWEIKMEAGRPSCLMWRTGVDGRPYKGSGVSAAALEYQVLMPDLLPSVLSQSFLQCDKNQNFRQPVGEGVILRGGLPCFEAMVTLFSPSPEVGSA